VNFSQFDDFNNKSGVSDSQSVKSQNKNAQQGRDSLNFDQFNPPSIFQAKSSSINFSDFP
jgi:hypothetical protein